MGRVLVHYEELGTCAVRPHRARHGYDAPLVLQGVPEAVRCKLALYAVARAAHACAIGAAALYHKAGYDSVEYQAIIETLVRKAYEVFHCVRRGLPVHLQLYLTSAFHFDYYHDLFSFEFMYDFLLFIFFPVLVQLYHMDMILPYAVYIEVFTGHPLVCKAVFFQHPEGRFVPWHHVCL